MSDIQLPETLILFRHGEFEGNERARLTGRAAEEAMAEGLGLHDFDDRELLPDGEAQANRMGLALHAAGFVIDVCMRSRTTRTERTAELVLAHVGFVGQVEIRDDLIERNRGRFSYAPDEQSELDQTYRIGKESTLHWRPTSGPKPGMEGETLQEVIDNRLRPEVDRAGRLVPGGTAAFATHGEIIVAARGMNELGGMNDDRLNSSLLPNAPSSLKALRKAKWVGKGQADIYTRRHPESEQVSKHMTHYRSIIVDPSVFDTGWIELRELRNPSISP